MSVNLSPARPAEDNNGLEALHDLLMKPNVEPIVAVVVMNRTKRVFGDADTEDSDYPVMRFSAIEPVLDAEEKAMVVDLLDRIRSKRTGKQALDLGALEDSEAEFEAAAPEPEAEAPADEVAKKRTARKPKAGA